MRLPNTAVSKKNQADIDLGIFIHKALYKYFGVFLRFIVGRVGFDVAMLVALWNARISQQAILSGGVQTTAAANGRAILGQFPT
jgi:hypothetical protein